MTLRLLKAIAQILDFTHRPQDRLALEQQAEMIMEGSCEGLSRPRDQKMVEECYRKVIEARRA